MEYEDFAARIGFDEDLLKKLEPRRQELWENSSDEVPFFMQEDFYARYYPLCQGNAPAEIYPLMEEVCRIVRSDPVAARYASLLHYALYKAKPFVNVPWPSPTGIFGRNAGIFQLLVALSSFPLIKAKHAELHLPERYFRDACLWLGGTMGIYASAHDGFPGHTLAQAHWLRHHIEGRLFRIGRLEYLAGTWYEDFPAVYQNRSNGSLAVLCRDGWAFDKDGFRMDPNITEPYFTARLKIFGGKVTGTPITPYGKPISDRETALDLSEWEPLCAPWDSVQTIHIPGGGGLTTEAIRNSLLEARQFHHDYLNQDIKVFTCASWILNPAWERELPQSNMAAMQRNVFMTPPRPPNGNPGVFFVYGDDNCDPRTRPQTTRLHQAFCRILDRGEPLRAGLMFLLASDVKHYGTEYYRKGSFPHMGR